MHKRIDNRDALTELRARVRMDMAPRIADHSMRITVHMGVCGCAAGARDVLNHFSELLDREGLCNVAIVRGDCTDQCDSEPMVTLRDVSGVEFRYGKLDRGKIEEIVVGHVKNGAPVTKFLIKA